MLCLSPCPVKPVSVEITSFRPFLSCSIVCMGKSSVAKLEIEFRGWFPFFRGCEWGDKDNFRYPFSFFFSELVVKQRLDPIGNLVSEGIVLRDLFSPLLFFVF